MPAGKTSRARAGGQDDPAGTARLPASPIAATAVAEAVASAFEPRRLTLARVRNGWTKHRLATIVGVTPAAITQYELGQARPSGASVSRLAAQLGVPPGYFAAGRPFITVSPADAHFRSLRAARVSDREQALAIVAHLAELILVLARVVRLPAVAIGGAPAGRNHPGRQGPEPRGSATGLPAGPDVAAEPARLADDDDTPERAARRLRRSWHLSPGPLPHLVRQAEMHGIVVAVARFGASERVDAFSCWPARLDRPVICLASDRGNVLRRRFSAAHEIAHLILHRDRPVPGSAGNEREADRFAAEFLMPAADIVPMLPRRPDLAQLVELQQQWGVSVQALLRRCNDLGTISPHMYKRGMTAIGQLGWRRSEPALDYGGEWPAMLAEALRLAGTRGLTEQVLANGLCLPAAEIRDLLGQEEEDRLTLRLVPPEDALRLG